MKLFPSCALLLVTVFCLNAEQPTTADPPPGPTTPAETADPKETEKPTDTGESAEEAEHSEEADPKAEADAPSDELVLPDHPGFTWWRIPAIKGAILVPDGWHTKSHTTQDTLAYFVTKSEIDEDNPSFDTGLSLNVFLKAKETLGKDALKWATDYRRTAASKGKVLESWEKDRGPFKSLGLRLRVSDAEGGITMHHLFVVNPKTDTLYFYFFEAPEKQWKTAWKKGEVMMKTLLIDDEV